MTTDERLEKLERELARAKRRNRRLLAVAGLLTGAFALVWTVAAATSRAQPQEGGVPALIRANRFVLEDENGKTRATLVVDKDGPALALLDENGEVRAMLAVLNNGPGLTLHDKNGKGRAGLFLTKGSPALSLRNKNGKPRVTLGVDKGEAVLELYHENGKVKWQVR